MAGKVRITITNTIVGSSNLRLINHENFGNNHSPSTLVAQLYEMIVEDPTTSSKSRYHVTRDSYVAEKQDNDWFTSKETTVKNYAFEPASNVSTYTGHPFEPYPTTTNFGAIALRNMDGSDGLLTDSKRKVGQNPAKDITIHVGGQYVTNTGDLRVTGSLGCFTLSGSFGGNSGIVSFFKDVSNRHAKNGYSGILITVQKRTNVDWEFEINKHGKKVSWNW